MTLTLNTVIALAVHASSALDEEHAACWLSGIKGLSIDQFNASQRILGINDPVRRLNIESAASDIVQYIQEGKTLSKVFVIATADLSKIPGWLHDCLELMQLQLGIKLTKETVEKSTHMQMTENSKCGIANIINSTTSARNAAVREAGNSSRPMPPTKQSSIQYCYTDAIKSSHKKSSNTSVTGVIANAAFKL